MTKAQNRAVPVVDEGGTPPAAGTAVCLSGGGYRAMTFHVGALWRMHELGVLSSVDRVSSVSGGSITAAVLAMAWTDLEEGGSFADLVAEPVLKLAARTIDRGAIIGGALLPGTISQWVADVYDEALFGGATLQSLPDRPRFVINATNLETGTLWRFSKPYMRDWRVGSIERPKLRLADAVAASSAFPPVLSPYVLDVSPSDFDLVEPGLGDEFRQDVSLTDGGVYDNLGLETAWKRCRTLLVSDGGGVAGDDPSPPSDWAQQAKRVLDVVDGQVRALRKRQLIQAYRDGSRDGCYWGMRTDPADYGVPMTLACPPAACASLAALPTRLKRMPDELTRRVVNWGYAITDAALRAHVVTDARPAERFPFPSEAI
ncbi:patatin-like phospholipase family protein [Sphingomonas sp. RIT328]|uniref:patatin-like phospholipase family protein n=1 Tax=Sphingomonas sp. RIT328 TaxID=1470591 RepID=UPI0004530491|nr:patatin-like phospholipase family protein [Sphingomonas sp. RIT328]EZP49951.1 Patatin-like phospholipase [Sphingomonas sp. RIT328]